jgi:hypothetical protein
MMKADLQTKSNFSIIRVDAVGDDRLGNNSIVTEKAMSFQHPWCVVPPIEHLSLFTVISHYRFEHTPDEYTNCRDIKQVL